MSKRIWEWIPGKDYPHEKLPVVEVFEKISCQIWPKEIAWHCKYYKRINETSQKEQVVYEELNRRERHPRVMTRISKEFDRVFYAPYLNYFIGISRGLFFFFNKSTYWSYCAAFKFLYVNGKFTFYSNDGKSFGVLNLKNGHKVEPFCVPQKDVPVFEGWTDSFYPVKVNDYYYLMDLEGNCFCRSETPFEKGKNLFATTEKDGKARLFGVDNERTECCVTLPVKCNGYKVEEDGIIIALVDGHYYRNERTYFDGFGKKYNNKHYTLRKIGYYGELERISRF